MAEENPRDAMRAGDADRGAVVAALQAALGEGRLDLHEVDERMAAAYAARTYAELDRIVADLPDVHLPWAGTGVEVAAGPPLVLTAGWSNQTRSGAWAVPRWIVAEPKLSDVKLDFRLASCPHVRVDIELRGGAGNLVLVLPDGWSADTDAVDAAWGTVRNSRRTPAVAGRPTVVVTGRTGVGTLRARGAYFYE